MSGTVPFLVVIHWILILAFQIHRGVWRISYDRGVHIRRHAGVRTETYIYEYIWDHRM